MRLYIKGDYTKRVPYGYMELAGKMWFPEKEQVSYSNLGNNNALQNSFLSYLSLRKGVADERWYTVPIKGGIKQRFRSHTDETIALEFEDRYVSEERERGEHLRILTSHQDLLTVDKRAYVIMAIEIATIINGQISEDDKATWISVEDFKKKHEELLSLTFEEANEISLKEIPTMDIVREPLWDELDRLRDEYIEKHGEPTDDDYDEDEEEPEDSDEDNEETDDYPETESDNWFG